jgi:hypothetical protein
VIAYTVVAIIRRANYLKSATKLSRVARGAKRMECCVIMAEAFLPWRCPLRARIY